jgi:hypothetical protein
MGENYSLYEFLAFLAEANGDEVIEIISKFQSGAILVEGITADIALLNNPNSEGE